ncbi:hypothetical protein Hanom_Chr11g01049521 [Helianthus anomalus]
MLFPVVAEIDNTCPKHVFKSMDRTLRLPIRLRVKHLPTYVAMSVFILGHQYVVLRSWYILSEPGCTE